MRTSWLMAALLLLGLTGCDDNIFSSLGDDGSFEARLEDARAALDRQDYEEARALLESMRQDYPATDSVVAYLSNALSGMAGIDTFRVLEVMDALEDEHRIGSIDLAGFALGNAQGTINRAETSMKLALLGDAMVLLESLAAPTEDHRVQLGLLAFNHAALVIGDVVMDDKGFDAITLTDASLRAVYRGEASIDPGVGTPVRLGALSRDIVLMVEGIDSVAAITGSAAGENDLSETFAEFVRDLDPNLNGSVSVPEIEGYLSAL